MVRMGRIMHGDALEELQRLEDNSVDAIVCDPPAGISFMGKNWDDPNTWPLEAHPGKRLTGSGNPTNAVGFGSGVRVNHQGKKEREAFISFLTDVMAEALRVLKPGGHALIWALPRTSHWTALALEDSGFEIRDKIYHHFGQGFPKSLNVSQIIQKSYDVCQCRKHDIQYHKKEVYHAEEDAGPHLLKLQSAISTEEQYTSEQGEILQSIMQCSTSNQESSICGTSEKDSTNRARGVVGRDEGSLQTPHYGREQSSMEGRSNAQEDTRQLSGREVCTVSSGISGDGAERRLCNGTSLSDGSTSGKMLEEGRSSTSHRPQSEQQQHRKSSTIPEQFSAQTCGRCGKKIIPQGLGTALKPSTEEWILCRKPLAEKSVAAQVLATGTGAINVDGCRIATEDSLGRMNKPGENGWKNSSGGPSRATYDSVAASGRWPAHLLLSHTLLCTSEECAEGCPVAALDEQSSNSARYFQQFYYAAKASRRERNAGCEALPEAQTFDKNKSAIIQRRNPDTGEVTYSDYKPSSNANNHPTVKAQQLMRYLVRMICRPGGTVLDMFAGSGSTGVACIAEGMDYILIEREAEYIDIIRARVAHAEVA